MDGRDLDQITNYLKISENLGTSGQPARQQFQFVKEAGYDVVVNLALPVSTNAITDEGDLVRSLGMEYVHIPVVWEQPTTENLENFFELMDRLKGRKVFVHCAMNMRVSVFVFLYRVLNLGVRQEEAWDKVLEIWQPEGVWAEFVRMKISEWDR